MINCPLYSRCKTLPGSGSHRGLGLLLLRSVHKTWWAGPTRCAGALIRQVDILR